MEKIKKWRRFALALFSLLFVGIFSFALVQIIPARADEELVLPGNTAEYTFENDMKVESNGDRRYTYNRATNEWMSTVVSKDWDYVDSNDPSKNWRCDFTLKLHITSAGNVAFQWKIGSSYSNITKFLVVVKKADGSEQTVKKVVSSKFRNPDGSEAELPQFTYDNTKTYEQICIDGLAVGDTVEIIYGKESPSTGTMYALFLQGLNVPTEQFTMTAKIKEGQETLGSITTEKNENTDSATSFQVSRGYDEAVSFLAQPNEGYVAHWEDTEGNVVSYFSSFSIASVSETEKDVTYVAVFTDKNAIPITYDENEESNPKLNGWKDEGDGKYLLQPLTEWDDAVSKTLAKIKVTFFGNRLITFDYLEKAGKTTATRFWKLEYTIDDGEAQALGATSELTSYSIHVKGDGYHELIIYVRCSSSSALRYAIEEYRVENIQVTTPKTQEYTFDYNQEYGTVYFDGEKIERSFIAYEGFEYTLTQSAMKEVVSSLDDTTSTSVLFKNWRFGENDFTANSITLKYEGENTYINGQEVGSVTSGSAKFEEKIIDPVIWKQTQTAETTTDRVKKGEEVVIPLKDTADGSFRLLFSGFGKGTEKFTLYVNGKETQVLTSEKSQIAGLLSLSQDVVDSLLSDTVFYWLQPKLGATDYLLQLDYQCEGYDGVASTTFSVTYSVDPVEAKKDGEMGSYFNANPYNNLFTDESEAGAYIPNNQASSSNNWYPSSEWDEDEETKSTPFAGKTRLSSGSGWNQSRMIVSLATREGSGDVKHYSGVLSFDFYLADSEASADGNENIQVFARLNLGYINFNYADSYIDRVSGSSSSPTARSDNEIVTDPTTGCTNNNGSFTVSSERYIRLLTHTSSVGIFTGTAGSNSYVTELGGGWYRCTIANVYESKYATAIYKGDTPPYVGEPNGETMYSHTAESMEICVLWRNTECRYAIRNLTFRNGKDTNFTFSTNDSQYNDRVTAQSGGTSLTLNQAKELPFGSAISLTATPKENEVFYGWEVISDGNSTFYDSTSVQDNQYTLQYTLFDPVEVKAWFGTEGQYAARINGQFYSSLAKALNALDGKNGDIIIVQDNLTISSSLIIPKGVRIIIPYNRAGSIFGTAESGRNATSNRIAWAEASLIAQNRYLTVTVASNAVITVKGSLIVGGVVNHPDQGYQGHTSGAYSELILKTGSKIQVAEGGMMDVYGRVWGGDGATDMGTIDVASGGNLAEPFLILDFAGGSNALSCFMDGTTPFKRYAMINIECPMTVHYGAKLIGHATLYVNTMGLFVSLDQPFISDENGAGDADTFIMLHKDSSVTITYDPKKIVENASAANCTELIGETTMKFEGGATFSYMLFSAMGISIPTTPVMFSIPYNFNVELNGEGAQYETITDFMIMPGATVKVGAGATLTLNANTWVLDGFAGGAQAGKQYPLKDDLVKGGYSASGNLIVNGTLKIGRKVPPKVSVTISLEPEDESVPVAFIGIVQTEGGGRIEIPADTVLSGKVWVGIQNADYFAYTTTARVWDKVHNCFGELVAGHTYTATSGDDFTLNELKYTNTANGAETETLALSSNMVGTWKVDHDENHKYNWTPVESDKLADGELFKKIDRTCTELGCDHKEEKYLFSAAADLGSLTFRGSEFKESDLVELFKKYFTKDVLDSFPEEIKVTASGFGVAKDVNEAGYSVTITLDKGVWLKDGVYVGSETFHWSITRLSLEGVGTAEPTQSKTTYNGEEQKLGVTVTVDGIDGNLQSGTDYEIVSYKGDTTNVGEVTVTIEGKGNYEGTITCTYQIVAKTVNLKLTKQSAAYSGTMPKVDSTQYTTNDILAKDMDNVEITIDFATKEGVTWKVGQYTLTASLENTKGHENYRIGSVENATNAFEITKKAVTVTVQAQHKTYNGEAQSYDAEWTADGLVNEEQNSVLGVTLSATGTDANSYDVTATYDESGNYTVTFAGADELQTAGNTIKSAFVIDRLNIEGADIQVAACTYNGKAQQPTLTVTKDGLTVTYTAEYSNNTNAGDASVEVTGNGNFTGTASTTFTIGRAKVTITPDYKISPKGQDLLELTVSFSGFCGDDESKFLKGTDYTVTTDATKDKEPGEYDITVELLTEEKWTNYTFEVKEGKGFYQITAEVFANVKFEGANSAEYDGETHSYTVTLGDPDGDTKGTFETPTYTYKKNDSTVVETMKDVGTYTVEAHITFKESKEGGRTYTTTITATFTITAKDIRDAVIELENTTLTYAHKELQPKVINVKVGTLTLTEQEYEVSYSANTNVGEATVTVTASGNFTGTATTNFTITARSLEGAQITVKQGSETLTYNGNAQKPDVTVTLEIDGDTVTLGANDYTADYTLNTNVGKATVTVTGKGNYQASAVNAEAFTIKAKAVNVTILAQSVVYAGLNTAPTLEQGAEKWTAQQGAICGSDDLQITLKAVENEDHLWSARTYEIDGVSANENYSVTFTKGTLTIQKRAITVTIADKSSEYGETYATPTWSTQDELGAGDNDEALGITLAIAGAENKLAVGTYKISGQASNANYAVTFAGNWDAQTGETDGGVYTVEKRKVTIEIIGQSDIYNNEEFEVPQEENEGWKVTAGSILEGDDLHIVLTKAAGKTVTPEGYAITGKYTEGNYEVTWVTGVYMIEKRPVTVKIANQSGAVYHYKHNYALDGTKWEVLTDAGKGLASGEEKSVLHVTLKTDTMSDAGDYPISGEWANDNYEVTFVGDYEKTETQSGHAGIYTIAKADVTNEATFMMAVKTENGDPVHSTSEGSDGLRVAYEGKTLVLVCHASIDEDEGDTRDLEVTIDPETLNIEGEYEVKITIVDKNYMGTAKYKVVVTDAKGYTPKLKETLAKLQELAEGLDADALTAEDFGAVKAIYDAMQGLDDAEREVGADDLAAYEELVESWNSMTEIDAVIETAESIADSAIGWLAQTSAVLTALAGVAYIGKKGGLLK